MPWMGLLDTAVNLYLYWAEHFRLDWSNMTSRNCPLYFSEEIESWWYRLLAPDKRPRTVSSQAATFTQSLYFRQQRTLSIVCGENWIKIDFSTLNMFPARYPTVMMLSSIFWESFLLLTLAFITASKCQWNWMRGEKCYATPSISLSQLTTRIYQTWRLTTTIMTTINNWSLKFSPAYW